MRRSEPSAFVETATRGTIETRGAHMHAYIHIRMDTRTGAQRVVSCAEEEKARSVCLVPCATDERPVSLSRLRSPLRCCVRVCLQDHRAHRMLREAHVVISSYRVSARYIVLDLAHQLPVRWKQLELCNHTGASQLQESWRSFVPCGERIAARPCQGRAASSTPPTWSATAPLRRCALSPSPSKWAAHHAPSQKRRMHYFLWTLRCRVITLHSAHPQHWP